MKLQKGDLPWQIVDTTKESPLVIQRSTDQGSPFKPDFFILQSGGYTKRLRFLNANPWFESLRILCEKEDFEFGPVTKQPARIEPDQANALPTNLAINTSVGGFAFKLCHTLGLPDSWTQARV